MDARESRLEDGKRRDRGAVARPVRKTAPRLEGLEGRALLSGIVSDVASLSGVSTSGPIAVSNDGKLWYTQADASSTVSLGNVAASGYRTEVKVPGATPGGTVRGLVGDPAGGLWFTYDPPDAPASGQAAAAKVGKVATDGSVKLFDLSSPADTPGAATVDPLGQLWIALDAAPNGGGPPALARVSADGGLTRLPIAGASRLSWLTAATDGALWFVDGQRIGRATVDGTIAFFDMPAPADGALVDLSNAQLTPGPDGTVWFLGLGGISRIDPAGKVSTVPAPGSTITSLDVASDGQLWFSFFPPPTSDLGQTPGALLGRMTPEGQITVFPDRVDGANTPVVRMTSGRDAGIWLAESNGTLARVNLAGVTNYLPAIVRSTTPTALTAVRGKAFSGGVVSFVPNRTDPGASGYTASIDWGDGQVSAGTVVATGGGGYAVAGTNTYSLGSGSTANVQVTVKDTAGNHAVLTNQVTIEAPPASTPAPAPAPTPAGRARAGGAAARGLGRLTAPGGPGISAALAYRRGPGGRLVLVRESNQPNARAQARTPQAPSHPRGPAFPRMLAARLQKPAGR